MNKNNGINSKILTGWLLLLLFALPPAAKTVHIYQCVYAYSIDHKENNNHAHHDCETCAICQFVLFPFTKAESTEFICEVKTLYSEPFTFRETIFSSVTHNYMLRAPPACV